METLETRSVFPVKLEMRQEGRNPVLSGSFPYGIGHMATIANTGRVRKEFFHDQSFVFSLEDLDFDISLLSGHSFDRPLASKLAGTLAFTNSREKLDFEATLPEEDEQPTWVRDTVLAVRAGLIGGVSPGFHIPPKSVVPNAETFIPEPGNPSVSIRQLNSVIVPEFSLVTRAAYKDTLVSLRSELLTPTEYDMEKLAWLLL